MKTHIPREGVSLLRYPQLSRRLGLNNWRQWVPRSRLSEGVTSTNNAEQALIDDIRTMRKRGVKLAKIAAELTERRIPTKTGRSDAWSVQSVWRILKRSA